MKKYIRTDIASDNLLNNELSYTIVLELKLLDSSEFKAAATDIPNNATLPTYQEVLDFLANVAPKLIDTSKFVIETEHNSDTTSYYSKLHAIGPEGYVVTKPTARVRFASHVNGDERHKVINNPQVNNIKEGYSALSKKNCSVKLLRALLKFDENTLPESIKLPYITKPKPKYVVCNSLNEASEAIKKLLNFAYNDIISCKEKCEYRTCILSKVKDNLWEVTTSDNRKIEELCEFSKALKLLDKKEIKNSDDIESDDAILDSVGQDIISKLSHRYPDITFYLIDIYQIKNTLYFEYNSSVGYHECIALHTDFSKLLNTQYHKQTVDAIYDYICELFDAKDDDTYWDD